MSGNVKAIYVKDGVAIVLVDDGRVLEWPDAGELVEWLIETGAISDSKTGCAITRTDVGGYDITRGGEA